MTPILKRTGGIWIGWDGNTSGVWDEKRRGVLNEWKKRYGYVAVDLCPRWLTDSMMALLTRRCGLYFIISRPS